MPRQNLAVSVWFIAWHGVIGNRASASSVGICWTRNEVDLRKKDSELAISTIYPLSEAARSARMADPALKLCVFTNLPPTRFGNVLVSALGNTDARNLFDLVLPSADIPGHASVLPSDLGKAVFRVGRVLSALRKSTGLTHSVPNLETALKRITVFASRIGRMINMMRAPYNLTLFLDDDVYLCQQQQHQQPPLSAWLRAYFENARGPDLRLSSVDLARGATPAKGIATTRIHEECVEARCIQLCNGVSAATTACLSCKVDCSENFFVAGESDPRSPSTVMRIYGHAEFSPQAGAIALRGGFDDSEASGRIDGSMSHNGNKTAGSGSQLVSSVGVRHFFADWLRILLNESGVHDDNMWGVLLDEGGALQANRAAHDATSVDGAVLVEAKAFNMHRLQNLVSLACGNKKFGNDQGPLRQLFKLASEAEVCNHAQDRPEGCSRRSSRLTHDWSIGELDVSFNKRPGSVFSPEKLSPDALHFQPSLEPASPIWGPLHVIHDDKFTTPRRDEVKARTHKQHRHSRRAHGAFLCACANVDIDVSPWRLIYLARSIWIPKSVLENPPPKSCGEYSMFVHNIPLQGARNTDDWTKFVVHVNESRIADELLKSELIPSYFKPKAARVTV